MVHILPVSVTMLQLSIVTLKVAKRLNDDSHNQQVESVSG